jgi:hypothetical protein
LRTIVDGGAIFVGDVRSLPLLQAFHTSTQLYRAPESLPRETLDQHIQGQIDLEQELLIDPAFFIALKQLFPQISSVDVQLKRGRYHNELTRFRYDVVLRVGGPTAAVVAAPVEQWLDWQKQPLSGPQIRALLVERAPRTLGIRRVANARLAREHQALAWLAGADGAATVGEWRAMVGAPLAVAALDPEQLWALADELPYAVDIRWSGSAPDGSYDVLFQRRDAAAQPTAREAPVPPRPLYSYANNPLQSAFAQGLSAQLRSYLHEQLPDFMVPATFVPLDVLPRMHSGKINIRALPAPARHHWQPGQVVELRDAVEQVLAHIWRDVLRVDNVHAGSHFFELGGHSLLMTQLISHVYDVFQVSVSVRHFFETPTLDSLAQTIRDAGARRQLDVEKIAQIWLQIEQMPDDEMALALASLTR